MMKPDDKERIIAEEEAENAQKVPKIQVYTSKALTTAKKPWFPGFLGIALASFAVILSLAVFLTFLGYMGMLPQKVRRNWLVRQLVHRSVQSQLQTKNVQAIWHMPNYSLISWVPKTGKNKKN